MLDRQCLRLLLLRLGEPLVALRLYSTGCWREVGVLTCPCLLSALEGCRRRWLVMELLEGSPVGLRVNPAMHVSHEMQEEWLHQKLTEDSRSKNLYKDVVFHEIPSFPCAMSSRRTSRCLENLLRARASVGH